MEKTFKVELDDNTLEDYESFLSKFGTWTQYKREIKLSTLLNEGKSIEFTIDMATHNHIYGSFYLELDDGSDFNIDTSLKKVCSALTNARFVLKDNKVSSLELTVKVLQTHFGKILKELLDSGFEFIIKQRLSSDVCNFYISPIDKSTLRDMKIDDILK